MATQLFRNNFDWQFIAPVLGETHVGFETVLGRGVLQITDAASLLLGPLTGGDWFVLTALKRSGSTESDIEIVKVLGVNEAGYVVPGECRIRVERGHEGTLPRAYVAGDHISMRLTAGGADNFVQSTEGVTLDTAQTLTAPKRGTVTTDNDLSFDLNVTNNFACTTSGSGTLTFTNIAAGQSGFILLTNASNHTISAAATTKVSSTLLTRISASGTYLLSYFAQGGNVYVVASEAFA